MSIKDKIKSAKPTQFFDDEVVDGWSEWLEEHDKQIRADAIDEFADWLVKYKVIPDGAMQELIRDFNGEMWNE